MKVGYLFDKCFVSLFVSSLMILCLTGCAQENCILTNGESREMSFSVTTLGWNNPDSSAQSKKVSRATPITSTSFSTSNSFNLIADQNDGSGNYSTLIDKEPVFYSNNIWKTTKDYYWSGNSNKTVSFYAYYPTDISSDISHTAGSAPTLSYTVPDDVASQPDIIVASKTNVAGNTTTSTSLTFNHIFATIQFSVGTNGLPSGTITSISIGNVYKSGTYTFGSGWTLETSTKTFTISQSKAISGTSGESIYSGTYTLMMIPQTISSDTITVTYSNGGTLTKTISGTWNAGNTYIYNLSYPSRTFDYTGAVQTYTAPITGTYKIECWGAAGGDDTGDYTGDITGKGGNGGYTEGEIKLNKDKQIYIYVGSQGHLGDRTKYFNGGSISSGSGSGGGSTDIRLTSGDWNNFESLKSRIMVAAGGGGGENGGKNGGAGGGLSGFSNETGNVSGATQTTGFGFGTALYELVNSTNWGGGGNGYYSGFSATKETNNQIIDGGGGGSSFISGYTGCNAISESSISTNIIHTGSPNHYSGYVFTNMSPL